MSANKYTFNKEEIWQVNGKFIQLWEDSNAVVTKARNLKSKIEQYDGWKGKQKEELLGFLELLLQYHSDLTEETGNPFWTLIAAMNELILDLEGFTTASPSYTELEKK